MPRVYMRTPPEERFWPKVTAVHTGCWLWTGYRQPSGHGRFGVAAGDIVQAHRFAYELLIAPIPEGLQIDHLCKVPRCVNPTHMEIVTLQENVRRDNPIWAINTAKTHCPRGHEYDEANTYRYRGKRKCRKCAVIVQRKRRARIRQGSYRIGRLRTHTELVDLPGWSNLR